MELPDLNILLDLFHNTQSNKSTIDGYACFTSDSYSGVGAFCFCDNLEEWKKLYPAIVFIDALVDQEYGIYNQDDLKNLYVIYQKHQSSQWNDSDFNIFRNDLKGNHLSYDVNFLGKTTLLFKNDLHDDFLELLHIQFGKNADENKENFLIFLDDFLS
ncbi:hypothetical protein [Flavobacterium chungnamense]|uniref:SMI1/KNR4 family protein n=1 Tax=Flavobacterium chungnamense TaxID=706182 RepID=A0ABP7UUN9_9FLAO